MMFYKKAKKIVKQIWVEFIYGGHLISLGAVSIVLTSAFLVRVKINWDYLFIVYLSAYAFIFLNRLGERKIDVLTNPERTEYIERHYQIRILFILFAIFIFFTVLVLYGKFTTLVSGLLFITIGLIYNKVLKKITRQIIAFKNICFSLMMILPLLLLVIENPVLALNLAFFLMISFVFFRMLVNTIFLDIKDSNSDKKESLITIPIVFGEEKTLRFLRLITLFSVLQILLGVYFKLLPKSSLVFLFLVPYSFYYFSKSKIKDNFYLVNYILADAEFILWPLLIIFGEILL